MILSPHAIEHLASRIEHAYWRRHRCESPWTAPDARLWDLVARALAAAHRVEPWLPLDPELFVMSQPVDNGLDDPWQELAPVEAIRRYRRRVRRIIRDLRRELRAEVRRAEARVACGKVALEKIVARPSARLSALGAYLVALRAGRPDLAEPLVDALHDQHAGCPLYRIACRHLIPADSYPVLELLPGLVPSRRVGPIPQTVALN